jgi:hypothetical protein
VSAAEADDVAQTIDYGKLFRRIVKELEGFDQPNSAAVQTLGNCIIGTDGTPLQDQLRGQAGEDIRQVAAMIAMCSLQSLEETAVRFPPSSPYPSLYLVFLIYSSSRIRIGCPSLDCMLMV